LPDAPLEAASSLVQRVYGLLLEARAARQRLEAIGEQVAGSAEAERVLYLGMVSAFEAGLLRTMEEALATMKQMKGAEAEDGQSVVKWPPRSTQAARRRAALLTEATTLVQIRLAAENGCAPRVMGCRDRRRFDPLIQQETHP
jgi:hypothetical protein